MVLEFYVVWPGSGTQSMAGHWHSPFGPQATAEADSLSQPPLMFKVRADFSETFEINARFERVRGFFADITNFTEYMPSIESIHTDAKGVTYWKIRADIPFVGSFVERFPVRETENNDERVEWAPIELERYNLLRYAADFLPRSGSSTLVQFSQNIELRRESASDLHVLAGLVGEKLIGTEMTRRVAHMLTSFIENARQKLES